MRAQAKFPNNLDPEFERWWARQDSNLQPDRYERSALTIELRARRIATSQGVRVSLTECLAGRRTGCTGRRTGLALGTPVPAGAAPPGGRHTMSWSEPQLRCDPRHKLKSGFAPHFAYG